MGKPDGPTRSNRTLNNGTGRRVVSSDSVPISQPSREESGQLQRNPHIVTSGVGFPAVQPCAAGQNRNNLGHNVTITNQGVNAPRVRVPDYSPNTDPSTVSAPPAPPSYLSARTAQLPHIPHDNQQWFNGSTFEFQSPIGSSVQNNTLFDQMFGSFIDSNVTHTTQEEMSLDINVPQQDIFGFNATYPLAPFDMSGSVGGERSLVGVADPSHHIAGLSQRELETIPSMIEVRTPTPIVIPTNPTLTGPISAVSECSSFMTDTSELITPSDVGSTVPVVEGEGISFSQSSPSKFSPNREVKRVIEKRSRVKGNVAGNLLLDAILSASQDIKDEVSAKLGSQYRMKHGLQNNYDAAKGSKSFTKANVAATGSVMIGVYKERLTKEQRCSDELLQSYNELLQSYNELRQKLSDLEARYGDLMFPPSLPMNFNAVEQASSYMFGETLTAERPAKLQRLGDFSYSYPTI